MWLNTKPIIKVSVLIAVVVLITGCAGNECEIAADCGQAYCIENFRKLVSPTCANGKCIEDVTECDESDICVQDSKGVRCEDKIPPTPTPKPVLSCGDNSISSFISGQNPFRLANHICGDDCQIGFTCNDQCVCECPDPVFTNAYFGGAPDVDIDFDTLRDQWKNDPEGLLGIVGLVNVPAYIHIRDGVEHIIPFPDVQLIRVLNPDNEYISKEDWDAYCVNDYFEGEKALTFDLELLKKPKETCDWGPTEGFEGVLTLCPEDLVTWLRGYLAE